MVFPNAEYQLEEELESIVRNHNCIGKHGRKAIGDAARELVGSAHVVSSFQTLTACDDHESVYESQVGGYPLQLRPCQRKWMCCSSIEWGKVSNEAATESSNVRSDTSESCGTWIYQIHD
ncbi:hypothetical protein TNCV_702851 [Trichonephila clavipes]|nr:hypothetical protein TNCV_702851 [Trichonephila clavipes]